MLPPAAGTDLEMAAEGGRRATAAGNIGPNVVTELDKALDNKLIELAKPALDKGKAVRVELPIVNSNRTVGAMLSAEREKVVQGVIRRLGDDAKSFGIEIVDVRIKRVDFVANITESVYRRMESERKRVANELRSTGGAEGEKIRADADRQREIIVAEAYRDAQKIKGEGDAEAARVYAESFGKDPQFAQFYRSLDAYKESFSKKSDVLVLDPSQSDFFKAYRSGGSAGK